MIAKDANLTKLNDDFLNQNRQSVLHVQAAVRTRRALDANSVELNQKDLLSTLGAENIRIEDAVNGLKMLKSWDTKPDVIAEYVEKAHKRWPEATAFQTK